MKYASLFPLILLTACGSSDDGPLLLSDGADQQNPGSEQGPVASVITLENHSDIVANVFAIFSGKLYGDDILTAPDYTDPIYYRMWPDVDSNTAELISLPADIVCENGGSLNAVPETTGYYADNTLTWHFDFDNCQHGALVFDGQLSTAIYESIQIQAGGFVRDEQTKTIRLDGYFSGRASGDSLNFWSTEDAEFSRETADSQLHLKRSSADYYFYYGVTGSFDVQADWTASQWMSVSADGFLYPGINEGLLELRLHSGNVLLLNAANGDEDTVEITLLDQGVTSTTTQPWSLWLDSFSFESQSGY